MSTYNLPMNEINKEIGLRIAESRKARGMTAVDLADKTGFSSARISHWEQGRRLPNLDSILVLQEVLDVSAAYLLCIDVDQDINQVVNNSIPLYKVTDVFVGNPFDSLFISVPLDLDSKNLFAVKLADNSMANLFRKDDLVVFHRNKEILDGSFVLFLIKKTGQILFRKFTIDNSDIDTPLNKFIPLNSEYEIITSVNNDSFSILGIYNDNVRLFL